MKFKVKRGKHTTTVKEGKRNVRKVYVAGDVVESNSPLDKIFVNKFERIDAYVNDPKKASTSKDSRKKKYKLFKCKVDGEEAWNVKTEKTGEAVNDAPFTDRDEATSLKDVMNG